MCESHVYIFQIHKLADWNLAESITVHARVFSIEQPCTRIRTPPEHLWACALSRHVVLMAALMWREGWDKSEGGICGLVIVWSHAWLNYRRESCFAPVSIWTGLSAPKSWKMKWNVQSKNLNKQYIFWMCLHTALLYSSQENYIVACLGFVEELEELLVK